MSKLWTVQVREGETWTTPHEGNRFVEAVRAFNEREGIRRLLLDGVPLNMTADHPDLFGAGLDHPEQGANNPQPTPVKG